jgi:hypothetical protein
VLAAGTLEGLVDDSFDIVAVQLPEVEVMRLRPIFQFARSAWSARTKASKEST